MDCVTEVSPTTSVTPPISPLKFIQATTTSTLPALKNLPTWNRTALERKQHHRSLTRDVTELSTADVLEESTCRSTQTTPLANTRSLNKTMLLTKFPAGGREQQNIVKNLERKLVFVQNQYEEVLFKLREEVGHLKKENMELTFQVVMKNGNVPIQQELNDVATSPISLSRHEVEDRQVQADTIPKRNIETNEGRKHADEIKIVLMDKELKSLRHALQEAKDKNAYLLGLIEKQKQRQRSVSKSGKHVSEPQKINPPGNIGHQPLERHFQPRNPLPQLPPVDTKKGRDDNDLKERKALNNNPAVPSQHVESRPRDEVVNRLIVDDNKELYESKVNQRDFHTYEISDLRNGRYKGHMIEPFRHDIPIKKPLEPLPRLSVRAPGRSTRFVEGYKSEGTTLPAVRPAGSLMERQRRAHALHVQRQKTNREFTIFKLT